MTQRRQAQKIFLDSRFANPDGSIDLPNSGITCHPDSTCWLTEFSCTASWWTIDESNDTLYVREKIVTIVDGVPVTTWNNRRVVLTHGPYDFFTLAEEIQQRLNGLGKDPFMGTYACVPTSGAPGGGGNGSTQRCFRITAGNQFRIPSSDAAIRAAYSIPEHVLTDSTNYLFRFPQGDSDFSTQTSSLVDLRRAHNLYLHTPGFGAYTCVGPLGSSNIIAKIPVDAAYG